MRAIFTRAEPALSEPDGLRFRAAFAAVPRMLGEQAQASVQAPPELEGLSRPHFTLTDWVRAALIAQAFEVVPHDAQPAALLTLFEAGEIGEQVSLLRTLPLLPEPLRFLQTALQACRTNARDVFESIVCENPYPAAHFPALNFNQAVLKAIFMEVPARRIEGLDSRITPELQRMAADYASERRAAGRTVPADIDYITAHGGSA